MHTGIIADSWKRSLKEHARLFMAEKGIPDDERK